MSKLNILILSFIIPNISLIGKVDLPIKPYDPPTSSSGASSNTSSWSSSISSSSSSSSFNGGNEYVGTTGIYGPFKLGDQDYDVTFLYQYNLVNISIKERLRLFNIGGSLVYDNTKSVRPYENNSLRNVTFKVPISSLLTNNGLDIRFEIYSDSSSTALRSYQTSFYYPKAQFVDYQTLQENVYVSKNIAFFADGSSLLGINEKLDFTQTGDYLDVDYYYRLSLNKLSFKYSSVFDFSYQNATLRFDDKERLFPYLSHDANNNINLPIILKSSEDTVSFAFKDKYYINKRTLQISDTFKPDYALTGDFYLPINGKKIFNHKTLYIDINEIGINKISTTLAFQYDAHKSLMGLCHDAVHCLVGGMD